MKMTDEEKIKVIQSIPRNAIDLKGVEQCQFDKSILRVNLSFEVANIEENRSKIVDYLFER